MPVRSLKGQNILLLKGDRLLYLLNRTDVVFVIGVVQHQINVYYDLFLIGKIQRGAIRSSKNLIMSNYNITSYRFSLSSIFSYTVDICLLIFQSFIKSYF